MGLNFISTVFLVLCAALYANALIQHNTQDSRYKIMTHLIDNYTIEFQLTVTTKGWVGVGIGPNSVMNGSDLAITIQDGNNASSGITTDYHGFNDALGRPIADRKIESDWKIVKFSNDGTTRTVHLQRLLKTEDPYEGDDIEITDEPLYIIWAFGPSDNPAATHEVERGSIPNMVNLLSDDDDGDNGASDIRGPLTLVLGTLILALAKLI